MDVQHIDVEGRVYVVEFSPYDWSSSLIAFATADKVIVGALNMEEGEKHTKSEAGFERISQFPQMYRATALSWSPESSILRIPKCLSLVVGNENGVELINSDCKTHENRVLPGHTDYVNAVAYEPQTGHQIASTSDDHTCRVWNIQNMNEEACFFFSSPGVSVCWHPEDRGKLLVATKDGIIHFFNVATQQPFMSLDCGTTPLMSADWSPINSLHVAALAGTDWQLWDTSRPSRPILSRTVHTDGGNRLRLSRHNDTFVATVGRPGNQLKVCHIKSNHNPLSTSLLVGGGISWHYRFPLVVVAGDQRISLYHLMMS